MYECWDIIMQNNICCQSPWERHSPPAILKEETQINIGVEVQNKSCFGNGRHAKWKSNSAFVFVYLIQAHFSDILRKKHGHASYRFIVQRLWCCGERHGLSLLSLYYLECHIVKLEKNKMKHNTISLWTLRHCLRVLLEKNTLLLPWKQVITSGNKQTQ